MDSTTKLILVLFAVLFISSFGGMAFEEYNDRVAYQSCLEAAKVNQSLKCEAPK